MDGHEVRVGLPEEPTAEQLRELRQYMSELPVEDALAGLKFARNRWAARDAGVLRPGRKSIVRKESESVTSEQAQWRLRNWKMMVSSYRRRGYSYPTISRIKKALTARAHGQPDSGSNKVV